MGAARNTIRFVLDDTIMEERDVPATTTVLDYLRLRLGRTGTKEGCAEGDCGACTVVLGELRDDDQIRYRAINACIRFLPTIDGLALVTSESLAQGESLHPVQQAMVDQHASQCGFCTPGFVMSLFALYQQNAAPVPPDVVNALSGNLCRCTGYRPIIAAGLKMAEYSAPKRWSRDDAQSSERRGLLRQIRRDDTLALPDFKAPRSVTELASILEAEPTSLILAGGTDVGLWSTKQLRDLPPLVYIGEIPELKRCEDRGARGLFVGAAVSLTDAWVEIIRLYPTLRELALRFASPPVCNSGTLGGNIANGSPIGDSMPALIALGAHVELRRGSSTRSVPLERFYLGYQRKDLQAGEFVEGVTIPQPRANVRVASYKVSKRFDQDISSVCVGIALEIEGQTVIDARIAFGGMAAVPKRAVATETSLRGQPWCREAIEGAVKALTNEFEPLTDMRASREYRLKIAGNFLRRFFVETTESTEPVRLAHG